MKISRWRSINRIVFKRLLHALVILGLLPMSTFAVDLYVDPSAYIATTGFCDSAIPSCNGSNWDQPLETLAAAVGALTSEGAGPHVIYLAAGVHDITSSIALNKKISIIGSGMESCVLKVANGVGIALVYNEGSSGVSGTPTLLSDIKIRPADGTNIIDEPRGAVQITGDIDYLRIENVHIFGFGQGLSDSSLDYDPQGYDDSGPFGIWVLNGASHIEISSTKIWNTYWSLVLEGGSDSKITNSVVRDALYGPSVYLTGSDTHWEFVNAWFAGKKNNDDEGSYIGRYMVYVDSGATINFVNTNTEMFYQEGLYQCSHHIYLGTSGNSITNHIFFGGGDDDGAECLEFSDEAPESCAIDMISIEDSEGDPGVSSNTINQYQIFQRTSGQERTKICASNAAELNGAFLYDTVEESSGAVDYYCPAPAVCS